MLTTIPLVLLAMLSCQKKKDIAINKPADTVKVQSPTSLSKNTAIKLVGATIVAREIGAPVGGETYANPNDSKAKYGINETDLGIMWETDNHEVLSVFGDNFGTTNGTDRVNWKSNALAYSSDSNLEDGMAYSGMAMNGVQTKELMKPLAGQVTNIPTGAISVGKRQFINYMAVQQWDLGGNNDNWLLYYGELAYSEDYGQNWTKSGLKWDGKGNFAQTAYLKKDGKVYMFGTPAGRLGNVFVARVNEGDMLNKTAYEYWNGRTWVANDETAAKAVAYGATSEFSVIYSTRYKRYFMTYLSVTRRAIVFRDAADVTGDWSEEKVILEDGGNAVYAPYFHPASANSDDVYINISHAAPKYSIFLYRTKIDTTAFNMISEGGFEDYPVNPIVYRTQWKVANSVNTTDAHSGSTACKLVNETNGTFAIAAAQTVAVKPNTNYILTGWAKSSLPDVTGIFFGVEMPNGGIHDHNPTITNTGWTKMAYKFNSGGNTQVDVRCGMFGFPGLYIILDDVSLVPE